MMAEIPIPKSMDQIISLVNTSCDNSCPPLNPIAKSK